MPFCKVRRFLPCMLHQKLHKVYESNGKIARLKSSATIDKRNRYNKVALFNVDIDTEKKAFILGRNKRQKKEKYK